MIKKDGSTLSVNLDGRIGRKDNGDFQQTYCIIKDITHQKENEKARLKLQEDLQQAQKMESIGRLVGQIAHDFNNMLTAILCHVEFAKIKCNGEEPLLTRLDKIENSARRSSGLIGQLLDFASRQANSPQTIDFNENIAQISEILENVVGKDITLVHNLAKDIKPIKIDPSQLDQIVTNLCVNARDAISGTGTITLEAQNVSLDCSQLKANPHLDSGEYIKFSVKDDGDGIDDSILCHIFEPFYTTKAKGVGTGLGLSSVYGIVQQNGGFINVDSKKGVGTTFNIFFPYHETISVNKCQPSHAGCETN